MLKITDLHAEIDGNEILNGLSLVVNVDAMQAITRPNGVRNEKRSFI